MNIKHESFLFTGLGLEVEYTEFTCSLLVFIDKNSDILGAEPGTRTQTRAGTCQPRNSLVYYLIAHCLIITKLSVYK